MTESHVVLGAGPAGTTLASELARRGHEVRLVSRRADGPALDGVDRVAADVLDPEQLRAAVAGAAVVYHCVNVAYHLQVELMPPIQQAVLAAVTDTGSRLVVLDTLYPYGNTHGAVMTERTPMTATTRKGRMRADLDGRYLAAHAAEQVRVSLGRAADFFGPGVFSSTLGASVFPGALTGGAVYALGDIDLLHSYTFIEDVATGLATLGEQPPADGQVWHLPTAPATTTRDIHRRISEITGSTLDVTTVPRPVPFGPFDQTFVDEYAEMFYQHTEHQVMDSTAFEQTFGAQPTPLQPALERTVDWFRHTLS